jgi:DNA-binding response OmpR family regulator
VAHLLLIEDDPRIREIVERGLGARGFVVTSAPDGRSGVELAGKLEIDLVLLDLVLPGRSGLDVLQDLRALKPRLPVIALTALADTRSRVGGLDAGADDYVTKPFAVEELAARVRARLRWQDEEGAGVLKAGPLTVDLMTHRAVLDGREVPLSARELTLLATFVRNAGQVLSRDQLLERVWGISFETESNVVDVYVGALRRKLGGAWIETVRGMGYRLPIPVAGDASAASR